MSSLAPSRENTESEQMAAAVRAAFELFDKAKLIQGMACISSADVFGWTAKHAKALNIALKANP